MSIESNSREASRAGLARPLVGLAIGLGLCVLDVSFSEFETLRYSDGREVVDGYRFDVVNDMVGLAVIAWALVRLLQLRPAGAHRFGLWIGLLATAALVPEKVADHWVFQPSAAHDVTSQVLRWVSTGALLAVGAALTALLVSPGRRWGFRRVVLPAAYTAVLATMLGGAIHEIGEGPSAEVRRHERYHACAPLSRAYTTLSEGEAFIAELEESVADDPHDLKERGKLVHAYIQSDVEHDAGFAEHLGYLVERCPHSPFHGYLFLTRRFEQALPVLAEMWRRQAAEHPDEWRVQLNAGIFMGWRGLDERRPALRYIGRAWALAPGQHDVATSLRRELHFALQGMEPGPERTAIAEHAVEFAGFERHGHLSSSDEMRRIAKDSGFTTHQTVQTRTPDRVRLGARAAAILGDDAALEAFARRLIDIGSAADAHAGYTALGLLALARGDVEAAGDRLLASARVEEEDASRFGPTPPPLPPGIDDGFSPNLLLARRLLEEGARDVVAQFLEECSGCGPEAQNREWRDRIRDGQVPAFGDELAHGFVRERWQRGD